MPRLRKIFLARVAFALAVLAVGAVAVQSLTMEFVPAAHADCIAQTGCTSESPAVTCSDGTHWANICVANLNCHYACCPGPQYILWHGECIPYE